MAMHGYTPKGAYIANINIRHTVADAAASAVWAMHNPAASARTIYIRAINWMLGFDGALSTLDIAYEFIRFTVADPTTGTTVPVIKKNNGYNASAIGSTNIQQKSGILTLAGAVFESGPFHVIRIPASVTNTISEGDLQFHQAMEGTSNFDLRPDEGMAIRLNLAAIIGQMLAGSVEWDEH